MRIAILTQSYPPMVSGAAVCAGRLAESMAARGHQVLVVAASERGGTYLTEEANLSVHRLHSHHNPLRVGQRFMLFPRREVLDALRKFQPEVIHAHEPLLMGLLGLEYARRQQIPIALTIHQLPWFAASYLPDVAGLRGRTESVLWIYARWLLRRFTHIITPTQTVSALIADKTGLLAQTISSGVDLETFHPAGGRETAAARLRMKLPPGAPIILHVGRLDADKCVDHVVQAAAPALRRTDAHLVIAGDGRQKSGLIRLCETLGVSDRVHFTGYVSLQKGLPEIYRLASLFVTASEIETQGIVLLEAAASGLPIVALRATCIPEIVHDGVNGYLCEPGDAAGMSQAITALLKNPSGARKMGRAGRLITQSHALDRTLALHEGLYLRMFRRLGNKLPAQSDVKILVND